MKTLLPAALLLVALFLPSCENLPLPIEAPRVEFGDRLEIIGAENGVLPLAIKNGSLELPDGPLTPLRSDRKGDTYGLRLHLRSQAGRNFIGALFVEIRAFGSPNDRRSTLLERIPIRNLPPNGGAFQVEIPGLTIPTGTERMTLDLVYSLRTLRDGVISRVLINYCLPCRLNWRCRLQNGAYRPYNCEFQFRQLTVLDGKGDPVTTWQSQADTLRLQLSKATAAVPSGPGGTLYTFPFRARFKRVAAPAFPTSEGYKLGYSWLTAPLNTPGSGGSLAEYKYAATGIALPMAVGTTADVDFTMNVLIVSGSPVLPPAFFGIENDVTTTYITGTPAYMSDKAEAFIKPVLRFGP